MVDLDNAVAEGKEQVTDRQVALGEEHVAPGEGQVALGEEHVAPGEGQVALGELDGVEGVVTALASSLSNTESAPGPAPIASAKGGRAR